MNSKVVEITELLARHFPGMDGLTEPDIRSILDSANTYVFPANKQVSAPGTRSELFILVLSGSIRVQVVTDSGREIVLYHVRPGDGCILTTSSLISGENFPAEGITDTSTEVLALSHSAFDKALDESAAFRRFVFSNLGQRLADVISRIEQLCSPSIDRHLAGLLVKLPTNSDNSVTVTHQELAGNLGTAREVVSRHLKRFESNGWVLLGRGSIHIQNADALSQLATR